MIRALAIPRSRFNAARPPVAVDELQYYVRDTDSRVGGNRILGARRLKHHPNALIHRRAMSPRHASTEGRAERPGSFRL